MERVQRYEWGTDGVCNTEVGCGQVPGDLSRIFRAAVCPDDSDGDPDILFNWQEMRVYL